MNNQLPRHIAIVMDGNRRWAKQRQLTPIAGHKAGVEAASEAIKASAKHGIQYLSLFAFSSENWQRPQDEVNLLMDLFCNTLGQELENLSRNKVCLRFVGDNSKFPEKLRQQMSEAERLTKNNDGICVNVAVNYGGRWDIIEATRKVAHQLVTGEINEAMIDERYFSSVLSLGNTPEPDLFIRTSGEQRISNFFLWQLAYTELYFVDSFWPDFREQDLLQALDIYMKRKRRFGALSEYPQVSGELV